MLFYFRKKNNSAISAGKVTTVWLSALSPFELSQTSVTFHAKIALFFFEIWKDSKTGLFHRKKLHCYFSEIWEDLNGG